MSQTRRRFRGTTPEARTVTQFIPSRSTSAQLNTGQEPVALVESEHRLGHPEDYLLSLPKKYISGSKYPKMFNLNLKTKALEGRRGYQTTAAHPVQGDVYAAKRT